jgi:hypothetical protein
MIKLAIRTLPQFNESIWGWALRTAELNGHPNPSLILEYVGLGRSTAPRNQVLGRLGALVDASPSMFDPIVPRHKGGALKPSVFFGLGLAGWLCESNKPKVCVLCLRERTFLPFTWDLGLWTNCPIHNCMLIKNCPNCETQISWHRGHVDCCGKCGSGFLSAEVTDALPSEAELVSFVAGRLGVCDSRSCSRLGSAFGSQSPGDVIRMVAALGVAIAKQSPGVKAWQKFESSAITKFAADALLDWPHGFHAVLRNIENNGVRHIDRRFGTLFNRLARNRPGGIMPASCTPIFKREILAYMGEDDTLGDEEGNQARWLTRREVSERFGISKDQVAGLERRKCIPTMAVERTGCIFIDAKYLESFDIRKNADEIPITIAAELLGVHFAAAQRLITAGFIERIFRPHRTFVSRSSVTEFLDQIGCLPRKNKRQMVRPTTLPEMTCGYPGIGIEEFVKKILSRQLLPIQLVHEEIGLKRFLFEKADVRKCADQIKFEKGCIGRVHVAAMLHCPITAVQSLLKLGFLEPASCDATGFEISLVSAQRFHESFATTSSIARAYGTAAKGLGSRLRSRGLMPAWESPDGRRCIFWDLAQARRLLSRDFENNAAVN